MINVNRKRSVRGVMAFSDQRERERERRGEGRKRLELMKRARRRTSWGSIYLYFSSLHQFFVTVRDP